MKILDNLGNLENEFMFYLFGTLLLILVIFIVYKFFKIESDHKKTLIKTNDFSKSKNTFV